MPYNVVSPGHREKFLPGAFAGRLGDVALDVQHDRRRIVARTGGGGLELRDTPAALYMTADLPETREASDALTLVRQRILRSLSVEFVSLRERYVTGVRVIEQAALPRLSVVDSGSYPGTGVEARRTEQRRRIGRVRGRIPKGRNLSCGCHRGTCTTVSFGKDSFKRSLADPNREILAIKGEYQNAIASRRRGTMQIDDLDDELQITVNVFDTSAGRDLLEQIVATRVLIRPYFDQARSRFTERNGVAKYDDLWLRALIIGASDEDDGWPAVSLLDDDTPVMAPPRRRARLWL